MIVNNWMAAPALAATLLTSCSASSGAIAAEQLQQAAEKGDSRRVEALLGRGADIDNRDADGRTPLLIAVRAKQIETARTLIDAGADVNAKDRMQDSPYLYAGASGQNDILRMTLAHGADLRSTNRYGGTALIPAAERGHVATVQLLIEAGVDVDHINNLGWTALLETVILGDGSSRYVDITRLLIAAGADVNLADAEGVTPLAHARQRGQHVIEDLLRKAGAH